MSLNTWKLSKFDVAERQLLQSIRLFFSGGDEVSIHTLVEAASQILYDTRKQHGGTSLLRDSDVIRPERKNEWLGYISRSKNFFKHADRDATELHEFKSVFNHFSLLDAVSLYGSAKKSWVPETFVFFAWFVLTYPDLLNENDPLLSAFLISPNLCDKEDLSLWFACIDELRSGQRSLPNITLAMGLPA